MLLIVVSGHATVDDYIPEPCDSHPIWSPDGTQIAFVSTRNGPGGTPYGPDNIWVVNADGTNRRQLTTDGGNSHPTWSPDGTKIAYTAGAQVWYVTVATGAITHLTEGERGCFDPDWNPLDAKKIICWFKTDIGDNDIFLINTDTCLTEASGRRPLKIRSGFDGRPRWSRDGAKIAFVGEVVEPTSSYHLMIMNADGSNLETHCEVSEWLSTISWFPDGNRIVLDRGKVYNLTKHESSQLFGEPVVQEPDISPNGTRVAYVDYIEDAGQFIFVRNIDGTGKVQITSP
jgi:Tol biopolymer transport system component